jgi:hypothetical protein
MMRLRRRNPETKRFVVYQDDTCYNLARAAREKVKAGKGQAAAFMPEFLPAAS